MLLARLLAASTDTNLSGGMVGGVQDATDPGVARITTAAQRSTMVLRTAVIVFEPEPPIAVTVTGQPHIRLVTDLTSVAMARRTTPTRGLFQLRSLTRS
jgi:hypothetical protein